MIAENFVITDFVTSFIAEDPKGRKKYFPNRCSACFIIPISGKISFSGKTESVVADASHPVFLPEGFSYTNECLESAQSYVFNIRTQTPYAHPRTLHTVPTQRLITLYEKIQQAECLSTLQGRITVFACLYALAEHLFTEKNERKSGETVAHALEYMRRHYAQNGLTAQKIAQQTHVSEVYLRKLFAKELATTPFKALTEIRMQKAKLLVEEHRPLKEIAACVGYADIFQFSRAYKRYFGTPPTR